jgi:hypothetical protein
VQRDRGWIISAGYDTWLITGAAWASVALYTVYEGLMRFGGLSDQKAAFVVFIGFATLFDTPHLVQTLTRTHVDRTELRRHPWQHTLLPAALLALGCASIPGGWSFYVYELGGAYGIWHILRQNVGFMRLYSRLGGGRGAWDTFEESAYMLAGTGAMAELLLSRPFVTFASPGTSLAMRLVFLAGAASCAVAQVLRALRREPQHPGRILLCDTTLALMFGLAFVVRARPELVLAVGTIGHDLQYFAWIHRYQRHRYAERPRLRLGWWVVSLAAGVLYGAAEIAGAGVSDSVAAYLVMAFMMLAIYHYYIDGVIWRVSSQPELGGMFSQRATS